MSRPGQQGGLHFGQPVLTVGPAPEEAPATLILLHGRGGSAEGISSLWEEFGLGDLAAFALRAAEGTWYSQSFLAPLGANQPDLDSALGTILSGLLIRGLRSNRVAPIGFSQGACLRASSPPEIRGGTVPQWR